MRGSTTFHIFSLKTLWCIGKPYTTMSKSILSGKVYAGSWNLDSTENLSQEELNAFEKATVVDSQYGLSCCFLMHSGEKIYVPMATQSAAKAGDVLNLQTMKKLTLSKSGEDDILRIMEG
nr:MAG TPA: hypothetical protein [Crassvirales sp.]